jgi:hypothetical protein
MSPLERVVPLKQIARIRLDCPSCHTTVAFAARTRKVTIGQECQFCHTAWGELVERVVIDLQKTLERDDVLTTCKISVEPDDAL